MLFNFFYVEFVAIDEWQILPVAIGISLSLRIRSLQTNPTISSGILQTSRKISLYLHYDYRFISYVQ